MADTPPNSQPVSIPTGGYPKYVLAVLVLVYVFNFIDRQILSILNEEIKADLGLTDSQMGFLYGTVFAVFYAVFGIPLGRLADNWDRRKLISIGLGFWSLMTVLSGTARSYLSLSAYRIGVGVGESSATPAAFSLLSDYFSPRVRATVLGIYSSGIYIGSGVGIFLGGWLLDSWAEWYPDPATALFGLKGWQAAFIAVGLPGVLMALWVYRLREPVRGQTEGLKTETSATPWRDAGVDLLAMFPVTSLYWLVRLGVRTLVVNLSILALLILIVYMLIDWLGDPEQWIALGLGAYAAFTWAQRLADDDPPTFAMIFRTPAMMLMIAGISTIPFVTYGAGYWGLPYILRAFDVSVTEVGAFLGLGAAIAGLIGVSLGGILGDFAMRYTANARIWVGLVPVVFGTPAAVYMVTTDSIWVAYVCSFLLNMLFPMWIGPAASTINDMVMPRMRARASAFYIMMLTFVGLALGPYFIGRMSDSLTARMSDADALSYAILFSLLIFVATVVLLFFASRCVPEATANRLERARAAGEVV